MNDDEGQNHEAYNNVGLSLGLGVGAYYSTSTSTHHHVPLRQSSPFLGMSFSLKDDPYRSTDDDDDDAPQIILGNHTNNSSRKKLRLSKEQSTLLEDTFKLHTTLNPVQKQTLAEQLNLRPRQVEVWFQNRRARTKLKQTEVDCEYLRRCCEGLSDENKRLKKELQQLKEDTKPHIINNNHHHHH